MLLSLLVIIYDTFMLVLLLLLLLLYQDEITLASQAIAAADLYMLTVWKLSTAILAFMNGKEVINILA